MDKDNFDNVVNINPDDMTDNETESGKKLAEVHITWKKILIGCATLCVGKFTDDVLTALTPPSKRFFVKLAYKIGVLALSGAITGWTIKYVKDEIDDAEKFIEEIKVKISEEPAEA